jgi:hypothetical protein
MLYKFESTRLKQINKSGVITPDEDGYYTVVVGAVNVFNSAGDYYDYTLGVKKLFDQSSIFMRRVRNGSLKAEVGHPEPTPLPGMSSKQFEDYYTDRMLHIKEDNVCGHFKEIWLDTEWGKKYPDKSSPGVIAILGKVKPSGAKSIVLENGFNNKDENVCFSIRSVTNDTFHRGVRHKEIISVITFDYVNEPGISIATKWNSPALECMSTYKINPNNLTSYVRTQGLKFANESGVTVAKEVMEAIQASRDKFKLNYQPKDPPLFTKW